MGNHKVLKTAGINLRYSMYDFIDAVKKHNIIWDREHKNFHNRELRDQAWQQIGQQLCKNFELANSAERQEISKTLLKRWKNTRDSYLRVNRLRQSGEEIARASYIYEKELSFLLEVKAEEVEPAEPKEIPGKSPAKRKQFRTLRSPAKRQCRESDTQLSAVPDVEPEQQQHNATLSEDGLHAMLDTLNCNTNASMLHNPKSDGNSSCSAQELNGITAPATSSTTICSSDHPDPDPDQAFFDSIKPDMKRLSADQKLEFKIEVMNILRHFKPSQ